MMCHIIRSWANGTHLPVDSRLAMSLPKTVSQDLFSERLLAPDLPSPEGLTNPSGKNDQKRFSVYRNNVVVSLVGALADIFPAIKRLLGEEAFGSLARLFITEQPPTSPLLFKYGNGFADFIAGFEPLQKYPYLADVARIERAWLDAFHAADEEPLLPEALGQVAPEDLPNLRFTYHPASYLLASEYAAVSVFSVNRQQLSMEGIELSVAESCLITRPDTEVIVRNIPTEARLFFQSLIDGKTLGEAAGFAAEFEPTFDIQTSISTMLEAGLFTQCAVDSALPSDK